MIPKVRRVPSVQSDGVHCIIPALETKKRQMWWCIDILRTSEEWILLRINKQLDKIASLAHTEEVTENSVWWSLYFDQLNGHGLSNLQNGEKLFENECVQENVQSRAGITNSDNRGYKAATTAPLPHDTEDLVHWVMLVEDCSLCRAYQ